MPLDAIYLSALTAELKEKLEGGRIDKVQQPERDMLLLSLRSKGENLRLLLAAGTGNARVHLTESSFENPAEPPMFCMLLRKHLAGARIASVYQPDYERLLIIELEGHDEMGFASQKKLVAEMIGRSANLILVDGEGRIVDCIRRMDFGGDAQRRMLPGMLYRLPPKQDKPPLLETDGAQRQAMIAGADRQQRVDQWLLNSFAGLSPLICRELAHRCGGSYDTLPELLDAFVDSVKAGDLRQPFCMKRASPGISASCPSASMARLSTARRRRAFPSCWTASIPSVTRRSSNAAAAISFIKASALPGTVSSGSWPARPRSCAAPRKETKYARRRNW